jgi:hypothetical protein
MKSMNTVVRDVLARHTSRDGTSIHAWHDLGRDLDLKPLQISLVALEVEHLTGVEVPLDDVATAQTVVDLVSLFASAADEHHVRTFFDRVA